MDWGWWCPVVPGHTHPVYPDQSLSGFLVYLQNIKQKRFQDGEPPQSTSPGGPDFLGLQQRARVKIGFN